MTSGPFEAGRLCPSPADLHGPVPTVTEKEKTMIEDAESLGHNLEVEEQPSWTPARAPSGAADRSRRVKEQSHGGHIARRP